MPNILKVQVCVAQSVQDETLAIRAWEAIVKHSVVIVIQEGNKCYIQDTSWISDSITRMTDYICTETITMLLVTVSMSRHSNKVTTVRLKVMNEGQR